ncbi:MAG: methionyl-tRNA formyltransferase [Verrucomicrobiaceae bacterium]|nr:methionyl-tRNA formyltransferase [Verrucomicrobiaceae bacterium]
MGERMRIIFMGTGEIALPALRWLIERQGSGPDGHELVAVYTQPDKPIGRRQVLTAPETKTLAEAHGIPVRQPENLRGNEEALGEFAAFRPDLVVVMAYGQILPKAVISSPTLACVNLHASLLPRHRGASPVQAVIREGDAESGITLMHIVPKLDAGDMILKESIPVLPDDTGGTLHDRIAILGPRLLERGLPLFRNGLPTAEPQDEALVTYSGKLLREDGEIDWTLDAADLERLIRAYHPWPGTTTSVTLGGERRKLKVHPPAILATLATGDASPPGTVLESDTRLVVHCGNGVLALTGDLQLEGRKRLGAAEFLRGTAIPLGTVLGRW